MIVFDLWKAYGHCGWAGQDPLTTHVHPGSRDLLINGNKVRVNPPNSSPSSPKPLFLGNVSITTETGVGGLGDHEPVAGRHGPCLD